MSVRKYMFELSSGVRAGVWDQLAKLGTFDKDGEVVFDEEQLRQAVENFARKSNLLAMDYEHQALHSPYNGAPAPALAFYSVMMLIVGGKIVAHHSKQAGFDAKIIGGVQSSIGDGLWIYREEVTPKGQELLPNYKYISPAFNVNAKDEHGNDIGLDFINLAATNTPFLESMAPIAMTYKTTTRSRHVKASLMAAYGLKEGYSADDLENAMERYAAESEEKMKKMSAADDKKPDEDDKKMTALATELGCVATLDAIREKVTSMKFTSVPRDEMDALKKKLSDLQEREEARAKDTEDAEIKTFAKRACSPVDERNPDGGLGAWDPEDIDGLIGYLRSNKADAVKYINDRRGKFGAMKRFTAGGDPIGSTRNSSPTTHEYAGGIVVEDHGTELAAAAQELMKANPKLQLTEAYSIANRQNPHLYRR